MRKIHFADHLEKEVAELLTDKNINFIHESEIGNDTSLDFLLPDFDVYIEVKQFHTDRVVSQLKQKDNVILLQGRKSIALLKKLIGDA